MSETKKFMPTITNYLSDNEKEAEGGLENSVITPQVHTNYAEWKRLKKAGNSANVQNGTRSLNKPLADISSSEEDFNCDDHEPIFKIMNCLADKNDYRRRNENVMRKHREPSHFLLYSRIKQRIHFDCSFSDLCQITQASWENMDATETEELVDDIDRHTRDYKETLSKFRKILLPDSTSPPKINKPAPETPAMNPSKEEKVPLPLDTVADPCTNTVEASVIPERLQVLAGTASVYYVPDKAKRLSYRELKKSRRRNLRRIDDSDSDSSEAKVPEPVPTCNFPGCENKPIEDYRWNGQYCSAKCLLKDCQTAFNGWLASQKRPLANGDQEPVDGEIVLCLESPAHGNGEPLKTQDIPTDLVEKPQKAAYCNGNNRSLLRNHFADSDRKPKRNLLVRNSPESESSSPGEDFGAFLDNQEQRDFVT